MAKWSKRVYRLDSNYDWKTKLGNKVFVADSGALRFDFPAEWVLVPDTPAIKLYDRQPPDDNCLLEVTVFHLPVGPDWRALPLSEQLVTALGGDGDEVISRGEIVQVKRGDLEIAWLETRFIDPGEQREACSRTCLVRRSHIQALLTLSFWPEDSDRLAPVWDEILRSMRVGEYIAAPYRRGGN